MQAMRTPSKRVAKGFDVVVWVDNDGDIVAKAFTPRGHNSLRKFVSDYHNGDIVEIYCDPDAFMKELEDEVALGTLNQHGKVVLMGKLYLH